MRRTHLHALALTAVLAVTAGCAEPPTGLVDAARARVDAVAAEGQTYAPQAYAAAADALSQLDGELQTQADSFALTRSYERATELAGEVEAAADEVERAVDAEQDRLQSETGRLVAETRGALEALGPVLGEMDEEDAARFQQDVAAVESSLSSVESDLQGGMYTAAYDDAGSAQASARRIESAIAAMEQAEEEEANDVVARAERGLFDLPRRVYVDGTALNSGSYQVRVTNESAPVVDTEPATTTRWVEFLNGEDGPVVGRGLATVVSDTEIREISVSPVPRNAVRLDALPDGEYYRVWLNRGGENFLIHLNLTAP